MNQAVIGVGSNIDAEENVRRAIAIIDADHKVTAQSSWRWTKPIGIEAQPEFLNGAIRITTSLGRRRLTRYLKQVEKCLGRTPAASKFGPRTIDLDIVVWNGDVIDSDIYTREFLKLSVLQILPELEL